MYGGGGSLGGGPTEGKARGEAGSAILQRVMMGVRWKKICLRQTSHGCKIPEVIPNPSPPHDSPRFNRGSLKQNPQAQVVHGLSRVLFRLLKPDSGGPGGFNELDCFTRLERLARPFLCLSQAVSPPFRRQPCSLPLILVTMKQSLYFDFAAWRSSEWRHRKSARKPLCSRVTDQVVHFKALSGSL